MTQTQKKGIKWGEIKEAFVTYTKRQDKVKLGVAYLVECLLLGNIDKKLNGIDTMRLVMVVNVFNKVAWGRKGFDCLV